MTESVSFSSASEVNPPASAAESISVNSRYEPSTGSDGVVNCEATNRGVDNSVGTDEDGWEDDGRGFDDDEDGPTSFETGCGLVDQGFTVIPLDHPSSPECKGAHGPANPCDGTRGKHPLGKWDKTACRTYEDIEAQTTGRGAVNWGILTGAPSNLLALDEDTVGHMAALCEKHGIEVPDTRRIGTGREGGGVHWWFRPPADYAVTIGTKIDDYAIDWRNERGLVIAPGSTHASGVVYADLNPGTPIRPFPDELADLVRVEPVKQAARRKEMREEAKKLGIKGTVSLGDPSHGKGGRDNQVFSFCVWTKKAGVPLLRAEELLYADWLKLEQPPGDVYPWELALAKLHRVHKDERYASAEQQGPAVWADPRTGEILPNDPDAEIEAFAGQLDEQGHAVMQQTLGMPKPPIPLEEPPPQPYDLKRMGVLGEITQYVADNVAVPGGMVLMTKLGVVSAAVGGRRRVRVRPGWTEPVVLHTLACAPPGSRKSAVVSKSTEALKAQEKARRDNDRTQVQVDRVRRQILDDQIKGATSRAAKNGDPQEQAEAESLVLKRAAMGDPLEETRLLTSDITPEELAYLMARQDGRMAVIDSEAAFLSNISGRYSPGGRPKVDLVLNAYDQQAYTVDRVGRDEPVEIETANLTIALAIQGDAITGLGKACQEMDRRGTWGRYLYDVTPGHVLRTVATPAIPEAAEDAHNARITELMKVCYDSEETAVMELSEEARNAFFGYYLESDPVLRGAHEKVRIQGWEEKQPGRLIRIAALRALYENPHALEISGEIMRDVIALDSTMRQHAHKASAYMQLTDSDPLEPARDVLSWLLEDRPQAVVRTKDVLHIMRKRRRAWAVRFDDAGDAVDMLEEYGHVHYLRREDGSQVRGEFRVSRYHLPDVDLTAPAPEPEDVPAVIPMDEDEKYAFESQEERRLQTEVRRIGAFIGEYCTTGDPRTVKVRTADLYDAYLRHVGGAGEWLNPTRFGKAMSRVLPFAEKKRLRDGSGRSWFYTSVSLM